MHQSSSRRVSSTLVSAEIGRLVASKCYAWWWATARGYFPSAAQPVAWYGVFAQTFGWYQAFARAASDYGYICPAHRHAEKMAAAPGRRSPTFRYWFNHLTADWSERDCYNISHDAEIPYIFRDAHAVPARSHTP